MKVFQKNRETQNIEKGMVDIFKNRLLSQIPSRNRASTRQIEISKRESIFLEVPHCNEYEMSSGKKNEMQSDQKQEILKNKDLANKKVESYMNGAKQENEVENVVYTSFTK